MKIDHLRHHEIDRNAYDRCILQAIHGTVYAMSWYLDVVSPGWELLVLEDYKAVMPLPVKKRYGIKYLIQPSLCQQLGVFSSHLLNSELVHSFIRNLPYFYYDLQLNSGNILGKGDLPSKVNCLLKLNQTYEEIRNQYKSNCLRNLKKAEREGLTFYRTTEPQVYLDVLLANSAKRPIRYMMDLLEDLLDAFSKHAEVEIWHVEDNTQAVLACIVFLYWKNRVYYLVPVSTFEGKQKQSMSFLIDSFIRTHASSDYILDFEGSSIPDIARFYEGFGTSSEFYPHIYKENVFSKLYFLAKKVK